MPSNGFSVKLPRLGELDIFQTVESRKPILIPNSGRMAYHQDGLVTVYLVSEIAITDLSEQVTPRVLQPLAGQYQLSATLSQSQCMAKTKTTKWTVTDCRLNAKMV